MKASGRQKTRHLSQKHLTEIRDLLHGFTRTDDMTMRLCCFLLSLVVLACAGSPPLLPAARARSQQTPVFVPWSAESFSRASREHRLLIVSAQTQWCHWCHVMNAQTYGDPEIRALLDEHFVVIAVDADARPDIASRYAAWGWPATALLTSDAQPIANLRGYQAPTAFAATLRELVRRQEHGENLAQPLPDRRVAVHGEIADRIRQLRERVDASFDHDQAGYGGPKKFPWIAPIEDALLQAREHGATQPLARALTSLERYASLIDPVAGGMFQYSTRSRWDSPHYEKIHSVQADALTAFADAYRFTRNRLWLERANAIARYVLGPLRSRAGVFYANQDADVGHTGEPGAMTGKDYYARNAAGRALVNDPRIDTAIYANNNGMTITALCTLYEATHDADTLKVAVDAHAQIEATHTQNDLYRHGEAPAEMLFLNDQVEMADALFALHQATAEPAYWERLVRLMAAIERTFASTEGPGSVAHTEDRHASGVLARALTSVADNSHLARVLSRMHRVSDDARFNELATAIVNGVAANETHHVPGRDALEHLRALAMLESSYVVLTVVAPANDATAKRLYASALSYYDPARLVRWQTPETSHYPYPGHAVIYMCGADSCSMPIQDPGDVAAQATAFLTSVRAER